MGLCRAAHERFTVRVRQSDNHRGEGRGRRGAKATMSGIQGMTGRKPLRLERGRRRTRQDQIPPAKKTTGEIADLKRSAPNEESLFLLPDRLREEVRSSRLT
jgi:hypothetical protein